MLLKNVFFCRKTAKEQEESKWTKCACISAFIVYLLLLKTNYSDTCSNVNHFTWDCCSEGQRLNLIPNPAKTAGDLYPMSREGGGGEVSEGKIKRNLIIYQG